MYSVGIAYLLWLLSGFGALGFHRFYLGKIPTGILWMCTGGLGMLGSIYDFFTMSGQVHEANIRRAFYEGTAHSFDKRLWRNINDGEARIVREKETVERTLLRLAKENKGVLTASELALAANISIEDAKRNLDTLVSKGFAELRIRKSGTLVYTIPDLMDRDGPLEDF
ncbi:MAG: TM2 domain-containing protein [Treponema sp.]|jgi:TM2 domain-containing membrane protein YozV/predicted transcriptional regulator|nr:TM2 domain-containing protein [Treponema sp.]